MLRPRLGIQGQKLVFGITVPMELAQHKPSLNVEVDGKLVSSQTLSAGSMELQIDLSAGSGQTIVLSSDRPLVLPGRDGRSVIGLVRTITAK